MTRNRSARKMSAKGLPTRDTASLSALDRPLIERKRALDATLRASQRAWSPLFAHLPMPVRFRASGALQAWQTALTMSLRGCELLRACADASTSPYWVEQRLALFVEETHPEVAREDLAFGRDIAMTDAVWLTFWLRGGVLYEPTPALVGLLDGSDIAPDLPLHFIRPPCPTLCLIPAAGQARVTRDSEALLLFVHAEESVRGRQSLSVFTQTLEDLFQYQQRTFIDVQQRTISISLEHPNETLQSALERRFSDPDSAAGWQMLLEPLAKLLLYLSLDDAVVAEERPYTLAPRSFPGLGQRRRTEKLAEIEQLYDRYVVGPALLPEALRDTSNRYAGAGGGSVSPHWRRGHFRQ